MTIHVRPIFPGGFPHVPPLQRNHPRRHPPDDAAVSPQPRPAGGDVRRAAATATRCLHGLAAGTHHAADAGDRHADARRCGAGAAGGADPDRAGAGGHDRGAGHCAGADGGADVPGGTCRGRAGADGDGAAASRWSGRSRSRRRSLAPCWRTRSMSRRWMRGGARGSPMQAPCDSRAPGLPLRNLPPNSDKVQPNMRPRMRMVSVHRGN